MSNPIVRASVCTPYDSPPQIRHADGSATWLTRARTFVVAVSRVQAGSRLERTDNPDEHMLFVPKHMRVSIEARGETASIDHADDTLVIVPPGASVVTCATEGYIARIFSHRAADLAAAAWNADRYPSDAPDALPPPPPDGWKLRVYPLDRYVKPDSPARPFRSSNMLINAFVPRDFRRDVRKMTPHTHADFDQASLALQGEFIHHLRYPWTPDMTQWREDEHLHVGSPSVIVIPAQALHTTQDTGTGWAQLIDIFSPPRPDFVEKPGWICNEADYPDRGGAET
jgi:mannose-6-phosphate isomerase-like protein (cupin superfamily)